MLGDALPEKKPKAGAPMWLATFADLMSLLMCFFVLLLSFSEMDIRKYKEVAGSMAKAFGVQKEVVVMNTPMGTSFVATEFNPGKSDPTAVQAMMQKASQLRPSRELERRRQQRAEMLAKQLQKELKIEIAKNMITVETKGPQVVIRIQEQGAFPSGSDQLMDDIRPALASIAKALIGTPGDIVVAGHTDDVPIRRGRFRSNWDLSSSRAVTVVEALGELVDMPRERIQIEGRGEFSPLVPNDTPENRALNRRVEIIVEQSPEEARQATNEQTVDSGDPDPESP